MSDTNTIYRIRQNEGLRRRWDKLCSDAKRFILSEVGEDVSEASVRKALRKWKRSVNK